MRPTNNSNQPKPFAMQFLEVPSEQIAEVSGGARKGCGTVQNPDPGPIMHTDAISMPTPVGTKSDQF